MDMRGDDAPDEAEGGPWMTYDELATARGIDRLAAVKLALRHGWRKHRDKHHVARVHVPPEWAISNRGKGPEGGADAGASLSAGTGAFAAGERERRETDARGDERSDEVRAVERSMWQKLLADERERADSAEQECARLLTVIDGFESRIAAAEARANHADEALAAERVRAGQASEALAAERTRIDQANADVASDRALAAQPDEALAMQRALVDRANETLATERARAHQASRALAAQHIRAEQAANDALAAERALVELADKAVAAERARADQVARSWLQSAPGPTP